MSLLRDLKNSGLTAEDIKRAVDNSRSPMTGDGVTVIPGIGIAVRGSRARKPGARSRVVKINDAVADRAGIFDGTSYPPPIQPATTGDLAETHLGSEEATEDDVEVWDLASLGLRLGHHFGSNAAGKPILVVDGGIQPCRVQQNGGVAGTNKTTTCTFTYDLYQLDNTTKINVTGGVITPKGPPRVAKLHYTAATYGYYFMDADGSYVLFLLNEAPDGMVCT